MSDNNRPLYLYRYILNGRISKLYTMGGLKQVINNNNTRFEKYPKATFYDTSSWVVERIPIVADQSTTPVAFMKFKTLRVLWKFIIPSLNRYYSYIRANRSFAYEQFCKDFARDYPDKKLESIYVQESTEEVNI
jgi:hypothetical protein